jgi:hypothetical protein
MSFLPVMMLRSMSFEDVPFELCLLSANSRLLPGVHISKVYSRNGFRLKGVHGVQLGSRNYERNILYVPKLVKSTSYDIRTHNASPSIREPASS